MIAVLRFKIEHGHGGINKNVIINVNLGYVRVDDSRDRLVYGTTDDRVLMKV